MRIVDTEPGFAIVHAGGAIIDVYAAKPSLGHVEHAGAAIRNEGARRARLVYLSGRSSPPDDAFRKRAAELLAENRDLITAQATILEVAGIMGAAARSILAGISLLSRSNYPEKVFDSPEAAAAWLASVDPGVDEAAVLAGARAGRARAIETKEAARARARS
jgi:hypothetical protein